MRCASSRTGGTGDADRCPKRSEDSRIPCGPDRELYPQAVVAAARAGHEIADLMWDHRVPKERDLEYDHLVKSTQALERLTGRRPVGTRSHHTPALLKHLGYIYTSTDTADHLPYYVADAQHQNVLC